MTQEEEIFGRANEGVRVSLAFFCLITSFDILRRVTHSKEMLNVQCHISADVFPRRNCSRIEADLRTT